MRKIVKKYKQDLQEFMIQSDEALYEVMDDDHKEQIVISLKTKPKKPRLDNNTLPTAVEFALSKTNVVDEAKKEENAIILSGLIRNWVDIQTINVNEISVRSNGIVSADLEEISNVDIQIPLISEPSRKRRRT